MKKLSLTLLITLGLMATFFTACDDDDDNPTPGTPTITSLTPNSGPVGTPVTIAGTNFGTSPTVNFGTTPATVTSPTNTSLTVAVPAGLADGTVQVTVTAGGQTSAGATFTVSEEVGEEPTYPDGITAETVEIEGEEYVSITGTFDADFTMSSDVKWQLAGGVFVAADVTLTIEEGTEIYAADTDDPTFISVLRNGMIMAEGTAAAPIVMSTIVKITDPDRIAAGGGASGRPGRAFWGGIILNGNATSNAGANVEGEAGSGTYGDDGAPSEEKQTESSGVLRYVRIEYAGRLLTSEDELNSFSFNGVGSGTTLEYLQSYFGGDDGFEWFGGTVNAKYLVSTASGDDSFDWTHGWNGYGQHWIAIQADDDFNNRGIEADNNSNDNAVEPVSFPILANVSLISQSVGASIGENDGVLFRVGTKGFLYNAIITGFSEEGVSIGDDATVANIAAEELSVSYSYVFNNEINFGTGAEIFETDATFNNSVEAIELDGFIGSGESTFDPTIWNDELGTDFFESAPYAGGADNSNPWWTGGWVLDLDGELIQ